ncbi:MAG: hypothetical protein HQL54_00645 [Magnetococcales bacterium]|nr:hypothetical protein [Magnetococcales bacterium]
MQKSLIASVLLTMVLVQPATNTNAVILSPSTLIPSIRTPSTKTQSHITDLISWNSIQGVPSMRIDSAIRNPLSRVPKYSVLGNSAHRFSAQDTPAFYIYVATDGKSLGGSLTLTPSTGKHPSSQLQIQLNQGLNTIEPVAMDAQIKHGVSYHWRFKPSFPTVEEQSQGTLIWG